MVLLKLPMRTTGPFYSIVIELPTFLNLMSALVAGSAVIRGRAAWFPADVYYCRFVDLARE